MKILFDISKIILPAITTGVFTFFITTYTYNKNRPLDKIEIAYNRVYYPLYRIIHNENENNNINNFINTSKMYFVKYDKYIDFSTKRLFNSLCNCNKETEQKDIYRKLKDNIYDRNTYLRRRLGYLEPNILQIYKYTPVKTQITLWILMTFLGAYMCVVLGVIFTDEIQKFFAAFAFVFIISFFILLIIRLFILLYYKFKK